MRDINLNQLEIQLKRRVCFPYVWGRKQSDDWDKKTSFIYDIRSFSELQQRIEPLSESLAQYALNRWLNFWSAKGVEQIFASHSKVIPNVNPYDKWIDFTIDGIAFDHKTSVFPKGYEKDWEYARKHKRDLIAWLYQEQSTQGRQHYKNRIFVVLYDENHAEHWKLKAEITHIKNKIETYLNTFSVQHLEVFDFGNGTVLSDIIWVTCKI